MSDDFSRMLKKRAAAQRRAALLAEARAIGTHSEEDWVSILEEFSYRCVKCGCVPNGRPTKDHILPLCMGGSDELSNLQPLCRECNSSKRFTEECWIEYRRQYGFEENRDV